MVCKYQVGCLTIRIGIMTMNKPEFTISLDVAEHLMKKSNGKFFSATFIKRTDGTERTMQTTLYSQYMFLRYLTIELFLWTQLHRLVL